MGFGDLYICGISAGRGIWSRLAMVHYSLKENIVGEGFDKVPDLGEKRCQFEQLSKKKNQNFDSQAKR